MSPNPYVPPAPPPPPPPKPPKPKPAPKPPAQNEDHVAERLIKGLDNSEKGVTHHCFAYAWATVASAGGKGIGSAPQDKSARGKSTAALGEMAKNGELHVGDVIYVNKSPGADPSSTNLAYGPHWFVYMGQGKFADQYGMKQSAAEMDQFVPGRKIDTIYHCFNGSPADPPAGALDNVGGGGSSSSMGLSNGGGGSSNGGGGVSNGGGGASNGGGGASNGGGGASNSAGAPPTSASQVVPSGKAVPANNFASLLTKLDAMGLSRAYLEELCKKYGISLEMLLGVIMQESKGDPNAESGAGAQGLMQLMPATAKGLGVTNSFDPKQNVEGGAKYLKQLMDQFGGDTSKVLAGYNAGAGNVEKYNGVPPFAETQQYVANITASLDNAKAALA
ncbi:MAG: lytic transglycosylase protein [Cyanobacteria bacterium RYN_339]|nr:lytic transglycosylase protein [Cyanobacteria bacterium RYN_339]